MMKRISTYWKALALPLMMGAAMASCDLLDTPEYPDDDFSIVGTWEYSEPAIVFESDNLLTKAGAGLAANKIEDKLQEQLSKFGINPGAFSITFNADGTFTETFGEKKFNGKWKVEDSQLHLVFGKKSIPINTQLSGKKLMFVTDATKLLDLVKAVGSKSTNSTISTVTTLMKGVDGMQAGLTLVKKQ